MSKSELEMLDVYGDGDGCDPAVMNGSTSAQRKMGILNWKSSFTS